MSDPRDPALPADPADAVLDGLEPGTPLADAVERRLAQTGGPVPVDEQALQAAVARAADRIAALEAPAEAPSGTRGRWLLAGLALVAAAVLVAVGLGWQPPGEPAGEGGSVADLGPGLERFDADVRLEDRTLVLLDGGVGFRRDARTQPAVDRIAMPDLDLILVPVGTAFTVQRTAEGAHVLVTEGRVRVERADRVLGTVLVGLDGADLSATSASGGDFQPVPDAVAVTPARPVAPTGRPQPAPVATVGVNADTQLPAIVVLLGARDHATRPPQLAQAAEAAERIGSTRPLVALGSRLDPQTVADAHAPLIWYATARARRDDGALDEALIAADRIPTDHWLHGRGRLLAGQVLAQLGEDAGARVQLERAAAAGGDTARAAWLALGALHARAGRTADAKQAFARAGVPSPTADRLDDPEQARSVWSRELPVLEALIRSPQPWALTFGEQAATRPGVQLRVATDPTLIDLAVEERALEALHTTASTTVDEETLAAWERARDLHAAAADEATRRALATLAEEIRAATR